MDDKVRAARAGRGLGEVREGEAFPPVGSPKAPRLPGPPIGARNPDDELDPSRRVSPEQAVANATAVGEAERDFILAIENGSAFLSRTKMEELLMNSYPRDARTAMPPLAADDGAAAPTDSGPV